MTTGLLLTSASNAELGDKLLSTTAASPGRGFRVALGISFAGTLLLAACVTYTIFRGIGVWGNNIPVAWAFGIINFVWWIGIGHAGTFISAVLLLFEQRWRASINRFAEAMTLFAVLQAALFPLLHLGRPWFGYWLFPYPSTLHVWPQVKSALPWDAAAISTYGTVSLLFWYLGLLPDLASLRDGAGSQRRRLIYGVLAMGFRGSEATWSHYRRAYLVLAGLATPLVLSVHSIVSSDFAIGLTPGWHSTLFPPYFVAGAIFSGFAMVLTLIIPARAVFRLHDVITTKHLENCAKMILATGLMVGYGYVVEYFLSWYSGSPFELYQYFHARPTGPGSTLFYLMLLGNVVAPQLLWSKRIRTDYRALFAISLLVNLGMWSERFVIIVISLEREFTVSKWHAYRPTLVDLGILLGTFGFFSFLFLLFLRYVPFVSASEVKELASELSHEATATAPRSPEPGKEGEHAPLAVG